ncbi:hypothetical protein F5Y19DRAFT_200310 [Xylariaceae sp. FL1651]|nr:hypothetical protein F5Y19DRAFT_200310 [Xylariaceae sp. FL1651]
MPKTGAGAAVVEIESDDSESIFVKVGNNRPTKAQSRSKRKLARLEEYDADSGRAGSRGFQKWAQIFETCTHGEAEKSKIFLKAFRKDVRNKEDELKAFRKLKEHEFAQDQGKFAAVFKQLCSTIANTQQPPANGRMTQQDIPRKEDHPLFKQVQAIMEDYQSLMKQFQIMEEQLKDNQIDLPVTRWKKDKHDMKDLLASGGQHGEKIVESILAPHSVPLADTDQPGTSENEQIARELFKDSYTVLEGETWGHIAEDQVSRWVAIAKTVRMDISEEENC